MRHRARPKAKLQTRFQVILLTVIVLIAFCLGCFEKKPRLVPFSQSKPLMTYRNSSPRFRLTVFMYAPGNLLFQVENLLEDFQLAGLPDISSATGRIAQARLVKEETVEFNLVLPDDAYTGSSTDVTIPWILHEKGPIAFLRSEGEILVDIRTTPETKYFVQSVRYQPVTDESHLTTTRP